MRDDAILAQDDDSDLSSVLPIDIVIPDQAMFDELEDDQGDPDALLDEPETPAAANNTTAETNQADASPTAGPTSLESQATRLGAALPNAPVEPAKAYLGILTDVERAEIAQRAYLRGPAPDDPDWLIAYAMHRAVDQLDTAMAIATKRVATMLTEPREYIVHAEGGGGRVEDLADIRRHLSAIDERLAAFPYRSSTTVDRLVEPFAQLAESSAALVTALDKTRASTAATIAETAKSAREQMLRTAFEGHALPAKRAVLFFRLEIILLIAIFVAVVILVFHDTHVLAGRS